LLGYGLFRLLRARRREEPEVPVLVTGGAGLVPARATGQARLAGRDEEDLWEAARDLARETLTALRPVHRGGAGTPTAAVELPQVAVAGGWWRRWVLRNRVRRLWQVAANSNPRHLSPREYAQVAAIAGQVKAAQAGGVLKWDESRA
jgi:hypothetical protein